MGFVTPYLKRLPLGEFDVKRALQLLKEIKMEDKVFTRSIINSENESATRCLGGLLIFLRSSGYNLEQVKFHGLEINAILSVNSSYIRSLRLIPNVSKRAEDSDMSFYTLISENLTSDAKQLLLKVTRYIYKRTTGSSDLENILCA